jgi:hypothetical protein
MLRSAAAAVTAVALLASGIAAATVLASSANGAPPCWSNSKRIVCSKTTTSDASTTTTTAPSTTTSPTTTTTTTAPSHSVSESVVGGSTLSGVVSWTASTSDAPTKAEFSIDGVLKWTEIQAPYVYNGDGNMLDTKTLSNGGHTLSVKAYYPDGTTASASASVTVSNTATPTLTFPATGLSTLRWGASYPYLTNGSSYSFIGVGQGDADSCESQNPGRCIVYVSGAQAVYADEWWAGVWYSEAKANGWLLHDRAGQELYYGSGGNGRLTNPGNAAYQQRWLTEVEAFLAAHHLQGVHIDNFGVEPAVNGDPTWNIAEIANQQAFQAAQLAFIKAVGPALIAKGYYVLVNGEAYIPGNSGSDDGTLTLNWQASYAPYVSATEIEYWQQNPSNNSQLYNDCGCAWTGHWSGWQKVAADAQARGIGFVGLAYGSSTDLRTARYIRGSFLLEWNGGRAGSFGWEPTVASDNWNTAVGANIGAPSAGKYQIAANVWRRDYSNGTVVVNPTTAAVTVTVNGTSRTIAAADALILAP